MAILQSCCYFNSVRRGSFACGIYTLIYFSFSCFVMLTYLYKESNYLLGRTNKPIGESFLDMGKTSENSIIFSILFTFCSAVGVCASVVLIFGLKLNKHQMLLPWIIFMIMNIGMEIVHFVGLVINHALAFDPTMSILFTLDFFVVCLNIYCVVCVISQYQEYKDGRGFACNRLVNDTIVYIPAATNRPP